MVLKNLVRKVLAYLEVSPIALRLATGIVAVLLLLLGLGLVFAFPVFFTALFVLAVLVFIIYHVGSVIWSFIES